MVILEGAVRETLHQRDETEGILACSAGTMTLCFNGRQLVGYRHLQHGGRLLAVEVLLSANFLSGLGMGEALPPKHCHPLCRFHAIGLWAGTIPTPDTLEAVAARIAAGGITAPGEEGLIFAHGALALASGGLEALRKPPDACCGGRDQARLREARRMMETCPGHPWCIRTLARQVGLNERKLKSGFRAQFGATVNECLTSARLRMAHDLLLKKKLSVGEVSRHVGYANPRHLTHLFHNRYGVNPSMLLRQG